MLNTPAGRAWAFLLTGFIVFCVLAVSAPLMIRAHVIGATAAQKTILEPIDGAVYVKEPGSQAFRHVTAREEVDEAVTVATDEGRRAFLRLFDNSTLTLQKDTEIVLRRVRAPRYEASPRSNDIQVTVRRGRVAIAVASPIGGTSQIQIHTTRGDMALKEGSYSVVVSPDYTELTVRTIRPGEATVVSAQDQLTINSGRCQIMDDQTIEILPPEQNLLVNWDFTSPLDRGWEVQPPQRDPDDPEGNVSIVVVDGRQQLAFHRVGARTHGETSIVQRIDRDVRDFSSLKMSFEVLVSGQSLRGGGFQSTEFPVMVELQYRDEKDDVRTCHWGFYYLDPGTGPEWLPMINGNKVPQGEWYSFETDNLMQSLDDLRPVHIDWVRIYASGWDWDSAITNISLLIQE